MNLYAHIDCNNFYASCKRVFNLSLIGRPVIILSNNDGCAIARSEEAKDIGIKMGVPAFKIKHLIEKYNIAVFSANFELYGDMSNMVITILSKFSPKMEIYSIDECFLILKGIEKNINEYAFDFIHLDENLVKENLTSVGLLLMRNLKRIPSIRLDKFKDRKSIAITCDFDKDEGKFGRYREKSIYFCL